MKTLKLCAIEWPQIKLHCAKSISNVSDITMCFFMQRKKRRKTILFACYSLHGLASLVQRLQQQKKKLQMLTHRPIVIYILNCWDVMLVQCARERKTFQDMKQSFNKILFFLAWPSFYFSFSFFFLLSSTFKL